MADDDSVLTIIPNAFSRLKPVKKIQVEWVPLHMDHQANSIPIIFPSHALFGQKAALSKLFQSLHAEWPEMPWKCWSLCASYMQFNFTGIILLESPSKLVHDIDSWNPKVDSTVYKEFVQR